MPSFQRIPVQVEAIQLQYEMNITSPHGQTTGSAGDWLVTEQDGRQYVMKDADFQREYEPLRGVERMGSPARVGNHGETPPPVEAPGT